MVQRERTEGGDPQLHERIGRTIAKGLIRRMPSSLLLPLLDLPITSRAAARELLARGRAWIPFQYVAGSVDLIPGLVEGDVIARREAHTLLTGFVGPVVSVYDDTHILQGQTSSFKGQRVAVLAHWDPEGQLAPYVVHYLTHLCETGYRTVLVSTSPLNLQQAASSVVDTLLHRSCPGYDFTSWKAALQRIPSLLDADELLLTNDSIFAPVGSLSPVHDAMNEVACDFWGMLESHEVQPHLQSYYMVFRKRAIRHEAFQRFWDGVSPSSRRSDAVSYELGISLWLAFHGLVPGAFLPAAAPPFRLLNPTHHAWRQLIEMGVPLIKRDLLRANREQVDIHDWKEVVACRGYHVDLIAEYLHRLDGCASAPSSLDEHAPPQPVSVIMPSYNYCRYLDQAIGSVLNQTWPHWELLVVDDGSDDGSVELVQGYVARDSRVKLLQHPDKGNHGLAPTLELGIGAACYETLAFLESDDTWRSDSLEVRLQLMETTGVGMVFSNVELVGEDGVNLSEKRRLLSYLNLRMKNRVPPFAPGLDILGGNIVPTFSCVMIKKHLVRGFDTPVPPWLDWWLWAQIAFDKAFAYVQEPLTLWRVHSRSYNTTTKEHAALRKKFHRGLKNKLMSDALNRRDLRLVALLLFLRPIHLSYKLFKLLTEEGPIHALSFMRRGLKKIRALNNE